MNSKSPADSHLLYVLTLQFYWYKIIPFFFSFTSPYFSLSPWCLESVLRQQTTFLYKYIPDIYNHNTRWFQRQPNHSTFGPWNNTKAPLYVLQQRSYPRDSTTTVSYRFHVTASTKKGKTHRSVNMRAVCIVRKLRELFVVFGEALLPRDVIRVYFSHIKSIQFVLY